MLIPWRGRLLPLGGAAAPTRGPGGGRGLASAGVVVIPRMRGVGELREKDVVPAVTLMTTGQGRSKRADTQGRRPAPRWLVQAQPAGAQRLARSAGWLKRCFLADRP